IFSTDVRPNWINHSDRFWYEYQTSSGKRWYLVDPATRTKQPLFDNADLARQITRIVKNPFDTQHLEIEKLEFTDDEKRIRFEVKSTKDTLKSKEEIAKLKVKSDTLKKKVFFLEYDLATRQVKELADSLKEKTRPGWASYSPDTLRIFFARNYNLYWMDRANFEKAIKDEKDSTITEHQITKDGVQYYAWGGDDYSTTTGDEKADEELKKRKGVRLSWSPDGRHFVMTRKDNRHLSPLWVINNVGGKRPTLETYKYQVPGEKDSTEVELHLFDAQSLTSKQIPVPAFKNQTLGIFWKDRDKSSYTGKHYISYWLGDNNEFYLSRSSRDLKRVDILAVNINGTVRNVVSERSNVYLDVQRPYLVNNGQQFIHWSQRDGWGHFYLYNSDGTLVRQLTSGEYNGVSVTGYDPKTQTFTFTANGKEAGEDPYYQHHYALTLNGGEPKLLNKGNFDHQVSASESGRFFVNNSSRVNTVPVSELYDSRGTLLLKLEEADLSQLFASGYQFPEPFKVKAGDGVTDLYGVMYKPFDFDSTRVYPIIEYVYPGPQTEAVNKAFGRGMDRTDRLAQLGFIVITVGNRGGHPARSKWYHTYGYGNLRDYGLEDKKVTIEQLAARHSFIDADRVGIHGHSGGGFMSTAAMLVYPDFFKVAVSSAGNHENNIYNRWWSERHHGVTEKVSPKGDTTFAYLIEKNTELAKNLKGKLMLSTGDIDNNVHPANTIRMAEALIKANKRFDFVLLPGQRHGFGNMTEYFFWRSADYFVEHLLGNSQSDDTDIKEINRDLPLKR
ncbi:MAG: S9 family peptidase, partial [Leadbetterella sp.]|nr:S9 family peptidase [Leadbetterella sp.]